jgi:hypothetical protein
MLHRRTTLQNIYSVIRGVVKPDQVVDPDLRVYAHKTHPGEEYFKAFITSQQHIEEIKSYLGPFLNVLPVSDHAMTSAIKQRPGGIDLNFQPQFIQRPSQTSPEGIQHTGFAGMSDGFKGFNFNIVRFTSQLTINGALGLMLHSN